jgi:nucleoside-diphosphate-sugar epimerase
MRVLVAGATGTIGQPLVRALLDSGHEVTGLARRPEAAERLRAEGAEAVVADALDAAGVRAALEQAQPEVVVNELTSIPWKYGPRRLRGAFAATNRLRREGTRNLVAAASAAGAHRLVSQSSAFAYEPGEGGPNTEDAPLHIAARGGFREVVNALAELERITLAEPGPAGVVLRYGMLYGPRTAFAPDGSYASDVRARKFPVGGGGEGVWSFLHVDDAVAATVRAVESDATGIFNVVDDEPAPVREWLPRYAEAIGAPEPRSLPGWMVRLVGGPMAADQMMRTRGASNRAACETLGWSPSVPSWRDGFTGAVPTPP